MSTNWNLRFLQLAEHIATWSKDPSTKVGAVVASSDHRVLGVGYNGFPKRLRDDLRLTQRQLKYPRVVHAEANALLYTQRTVPPTDMTLYCTHIPCAHCAGLIIGYGLWHVVTYRDAQTGGLGESQRIALGMFEEAGVKYDCY